MSWIDLALVVWWSALSPHSKNVPGSNLIWGVSVHMRMNFSHGYTEEPFIGGSEVKKEGILDGRKVEKYNEEDDHRICKKEN